MSHQAAPEGEFGSATGGLSVSVLVIGPSGVGKSAALRFAETSVSDCHFSSLDDLAQDRGRALKKIGSKEEVNDLRSKLNDDDEFLRLGVEAVDELVAGVLRRHHVIDIGAGFMDAAAIADWFRQHTLIALLASPEVTHARIKQARDDKRTLEQYKAQEFSPARKALYGQAVYTINAECKSPEELGCRLTSLLLGILNRPL
jgi:shikimate kinase